ncbi:hypothetical protein N7522_008729 [Penicillium canescens]|uniref:Myb-like domain-containing protein n=1 Tax=Penicillium canescens TaxID=5083 RepID=A0AAD6N9L8_PENCN|nr:uncharacterized protein N7446_002308 [Penicillium canescens]KAJ5997069.1 hypothetical protein N7522_008729 [Penicillium canescens]KAJ6044112.1 hypothetical protein N7460_005467 [Penicillium canescens]KAJ6055583.1 hypothetical protein N7444_004681 [Penicillium canescens]KAJ6074531.1 hypothetical protein N7446_002308 [Penicillium canescens]
MSRRPEVPCSEELREYYESIPANWPIDASPFMGVNPQYCTEPLVPPSVLTPISLPDSSFRPSPALSHHSQDYHAQEYQYSINESISAPQGLGISAPFSSEFPRTSAPNASYMYAPDNTLMGMDRTPNMSPQAPPPKRAKRISSQQPTRDQPINIAPNPEGMRQMELERMYGHPSPQIPPRPRAPGRGRRDPQAEDEDSFVETLRDQGVAWKVIRDMFMQHFNKDASEARLQMRHLRRKRERVARWDESDVQLLIQAHELWERDKYRALSDMIKEMGATRFYSPNACKAQMRLLETKQQRRDRASATPSAMSDPAPATPITPRISRKRARAQSLDTDFEDDEYI